MYRRQGPGISVEIETVRLLATAVIQAHVARGLASRLRLKLARLQVLSQSSTGRQGPGISVEIETLILPIIKRFISRQGPGISVKGRNYSASRISSAYAVFVDLPVMPVLPHWLAVTSGVCGVLFAGSEGKGSVAMEVSRPRAKNQAA